MKVLAGQTLLLSVAAASSGPCEAARSLTGKVPLMFDAYIQHHGYQEVHRCEFEGTRKGRCCTEIGEVKLDGLRLCERHAERLRLEERATCWRAILAHINGPERQATGRGMTYYASLKLSS
jgi:hypothetical protein